ncbi:hypothetical protein BDP27DRAFT_252206 [Rhodocollybia butyracea]|uniref:Uncharacterized protein n=1 Tax=Rhodocollybia butyracea TaxID=206335 RepID=A0A9P5U0Z4_9AGAR|nr:hypothetical protein BDP27DRAFT_252206 [Rhodocollybia butyracea]
MSISILAIQLLCIPTGKKILEFHTRLVDHGVMTKSEIETALSELDNIDVCPGCVDDHAQPSARPRLYTECAGCRSYVCPTKGCRVFEFDKVKRCSTHPETAVFCRTCYESGDKCSLKECPQDGCERLMCRSFCQSWCRGEPDSDSDSSGSDSDSDSGTGSESNSEPPSKRQKLENPDQPREHEPRLAPCPDCRAASDWHQCNGLWACPSCDSKDSSAVSCPSCDAMPHCCECKASEPCSDCREKEEGPRTKVRITLEGCEYRSCQSLSICKRCYKHRQDLDESDDHPSRCCSCRMFYCDGHLIDTCGRCGKGFCGQCIVDKKACPCGGVGKIMAQKLRGTLEGAFFRV